MAWSGVVLEILILLSCCLLGSAYVHGDFEKTFKDCCSRGIQSVQSRHDCNNLTHPVEGVPAEQLGVCLLALEICCVRSWRELECQAGKEAARVGADCLVGREPGGEFRKECCKACQLGFITASVGMGCTFRSFRFGDPWDEPYMSCCLESETFMPAPDEFPDNVPSSDQLTSGLPNLCEVYPGELCTQICVPVHGSFICKCHPGFSLMVDGKTCQQIDLPDRCLGLANPCAQLCQDTGIAVECSCHPGYLLKSDRRSCEDIDECTTGTSVCKDVGLTCRNEDGSYICVTKDGRVVEPREILTRAKPPMPRHLETASRCPTGYQMNSTTKYCDDINECFLATSPCYSNSTCENTIGSFMCTPLDPTCPMGFRYNILLNNCTDINECAEGLDTCTAMKKLCVNTEGSYICNDTKKECIVGYSYNATLNDCVDINECIDDTFVCDISETCINEEGGYRCINRVTTTTTTVSPVEMCHVGFTYNNQLEKCEDVDECTIIESPCDSYQHCENTPGSYRCHCKLGYEPDPETLACIDVNECNSNKHACSPSQRCDNTIGSYHCIRFTSCGTGYTLNAHTGLCEDDDECALNIDDCNTLGPAFQCRNTLGSFRCVRKRCEGNKVLTSSGECVSQACPIGFEMNTNGHCADVDECRRQPCFAHKKCVNSVGSFSCVTRLECGPGYELNSRGDQCVDVNECNTGRHKCSPEQICVNRIGSYLCQCQAGYAAKNEHHCEDIDECSLYKGKVQVCASNSECQNVPGSYRCNCNRGFTHTDDDKMCSDVDECVTIPGLCQHNCVNSWGSYRCSCNAGFQINSDNRSCRDVNECEEFKDRQLCIGYCVNQPGSYTCRCPPGYRMSSDTRTCVDIDECANGSVCRHPEEVCLNTRGSYVCNMIDCPPQYTREREHKKYSHLSANIRPPVLDSGWINVPRLDPAELKRDDAVRHQSLGILINPNHQTEYYDRVATSLLKIPATFKHNSLDQYTQTDSATSRLPNTIPGSSFPPSKGAPVAAVLTAPATSNFDQTQAAQQQYNVEGKVASSTTVTMSNPGNVAIASSSTADDKCYRLDMCSQQFSYNYALMNQMSFPYKCDLCGVAFVNATVLNQHKRIHTEKTFICKCGAVFPTNNELKTHQASVHKEPQSSDKRECEVCGTEIVNKPNRKRLQNRTKCQSCIDDYLANQGLKTKFQRRPNPLKKCGNCNGSGLIYDGDRSDKPFQCNVCENTFSRYSSLWSHKRLHSGDKPHRCDECGTGFAKAAYLKNHKRVHSGERPFKCATCGQEFSQGPHLKNHERIHTGERPYACEVCGKRFSRHSTLWNHRRIHTGEKPYRCDVCGSAFSQGTHLKNHRKVHTGERPHRCDVCDVAFSDRFALKRHRNVHGNPAHASTNMTAPNTMSAGNEQTEASSTPSLVDLYKCEVGQVAFPGCARPEEDDKPMHT